MCPFMSYKAKLQGPPKRIIELEAINKMSNLETYTVVANIT